MKAYFANNSSRLRRLWKTERAAERLDSQRISENQRDEANIPGKLSIADYESEDEKSRERGQRTTMRSRKTGDSDEDEDEEVCLSLKTRYTYTSILTCKLTVAGTSTHAYHIPRVPNTISQIQLKHRSSCDESDEEDEPTPMVSC